MRAVTIALLLLGLAAGAARAQESQQDIAERIVREQQDVRAKAVEKVMSAPARAMDRFSGASAFDPAASVPGNPAPKPVPEPRSSKWVSPWTYVVWGAVGVLVVVWALTNRKNRADTPGGSQRPD